MRSSTGGVQVLNVIAQSKSPGGDAIDYEIPHICPTPLRGLTLIGALL
jgi:hypothetical protein